MAPEIAPKPMEIRMKIISGANINKFIHHLLPTIGITSRQFCLTNICKQQ
jgi:hypothetical protein